MEPAHIVIYENGGLKISCVGESELEEEIKRWKIIYWHGSFREFWSAVGGLVC